MNMGGELVRGKRQGLALTLDTLVFLVNDLFHDEHIPRVIDRTRLWRIEQGEGRLPDDQLIWILAEVLGLPTQDLHTAFHTDRGAIRDERQGLIISLEEIATFLDDMRMLRLRQGGVPAELLAKQIAKLEVLRERYKRDKKQIDHLIGKAIIDHIETLTATHLGSTIELFAASNLAKIEVVRYALKDSPEDYDMSWTLYPNVAYVSGRHLDTIHLLEAHLGELTTSHARATTVRNRAVALAQHASRAGPHQPNVIRQYQLYEELGLEVAADKSVTAGDRAIIYDGLGLGRGLLGLPEAQAAIDQARQEHLSSFDEGTNLESNECRIIRTEFLNVMRKPAADPQLVLQTAYQALASFQTHGYLRYADQAIDQLANHWNKDVQTFGRSLRRGQSTG